AGEHFVAFKLCSRGYIPALPREGSPAVDILASNMTGDKTVAIQVKTTEWATRTRGRGKNKKPAELQFPLGYHSAKAKGDNLVFAFVDLNGLDSETQPDVYLVPSQFVFDFCEPWVDNVKMVRLHIAIDQMQEFKNNWSVIASRLGD
ncbi:MAG: hypothetical protein ABIK89_07980, partial [Planctomycetota bacterium]